MCPTFHYRSGFGKNAILKEGVRRGGLIIKFEETPISFYFNSNKDQIKIPKFRTGKNVHYRGVIMKGRGGDGEATSAPAADVLEALAGGPVHCLVRRLRIYSLLWIYFDQFINYCAE